MTYDNIYKNHNGWYFVLEIEKTRARCKWIFRDAYSAWHTVGSNDPDTTKESLLTWTKYCCEDTGFNKNEIEAFKLYLKL